VVIPTLDLANGTGENYKFEALSVPIVPSNLMRLEWSHVNLETSHGCWARIICADYI